MGFRIHLDVANLRQALLRPKEPSSRRFCTNTARLVAAFYLGLPLFEADSYPTLFQWTQLSSEEVETSLSREEVAATMPPEFSARLPVVLLMFCGQDLEAVLYADHFSDRRSALLLRVLVDQNLGLSLTDEYVADFLLGEVSRQSSIIPPPLELLTENLLPSVLELDIILCRSYIRSLELHLVEEMELLFAQLPLQSLALDQLPRPPVYLSPSSSSPSSTPDTESSVIYRIHALLRLALCSFHITNRIYSELSRTRSIFAEPDIKITHGRPLMTRVSVVVLSLIYRDAFSLAAHEQWQELPEIAMKYKALIEGEEEEAVYRWHSLTETQDMEHIRLFFDFVKNSYPQQTSLPPLDATTRELWYARYCNQAPESARKSPDWISGVIQTDRKVPSEVWEQMQFLSNQWRGISGTDSSLIPIRLYVTEDVLCRQLPAPERVTQSAREDLRTPRESSMFAPRSEILEEYTMRAKENLAKRKVENRRKCNTQREPRYMKSTVYGQQVQKIVASQVDLLREVEAERRFLGSPLKPQTHRRSSLSTSPCSSSSSSPSLKSQQIREDAIRNDIRILNEKVDNIGRILAEAPVGQPPTPVSRSSSIVSLDPVALVYNEMPATSSPPAVEKLDFSLLSPNPSARPLRVPSPDSVAEDLESEFSELSMDTAKTLSQKSLIRAQSERLPLLNYEKKHQLQQPQEQPSLANTFISTSERAVQTNGMTLGEMKPMSRQDISALYRARHT